MPTIYVKANDGQNGESLIFLLTNVKKSGIRVAYPEESFYAPPDRAAGEKGQSLASSVKGAYPP